MRVLVVTVVHTPQDSRIQARQIRSMLDAGWEVTYAAPFSGYGIDPPQEPGLRLLDVPRARGRRRLRALRAARGVVQKHGPGHDVVLLHDPELLLVLPGLRLPAVVWDVHEDPAAAMRTNTWLPGWARGTAAWVLSRLERWAERRFTLLLAETAYQDRFRRSHVVIPNTVRLPAHASPPGRDRVVHLGTVTAARGAAELVMLGRVLRERTHGEVVLEMIGAADAASERLLRDAAERGDITWLGYVPSVAALARLDGALAGVSLLRDTPNYRVSMPTKVVEYMAHGIPVVTTPLPLPVELVRETGCGVVVPFEDPDAAAEQIQRLRDDGGLRVRLGAAGRAAAAHHDWATHSTTFLDTLRRATAPDGGVEHRG